MLLFHIFQEFPDGLSGCGGGSHTDVCTGYPTITTEPLPVAFFSFASTFLGFSNMEKGR